MAATTAAATANDTPTRREASMCELFSRIAVSAAAGMAPVVVLFSIPVPVYAYVSASGGSFAEFMSTNGVLCFVIIPGLMWTGHLAVTETALELFELWRVQPPQSPDQPSGGVPPSPASAASEASVVIKVSVASATTAEPNALLGPTPVRDAAIASGARAAAVPRWTVRQLIFFVHFIWCCVIVLVTAGSGRLFFREIGAVWYVLMSPPLLFVLNRTLPGAFLTSPEFVTYSAASTSSGIFPVCCTLFVVGYQHTEDSFLQNVLVVSWCIFGFVFRTAYANVFDRSSLSLLWSVRMILSSIWLPLVADLFSWMALPQTRSTLSTYSVIIAVNHVWPWIWNPIICTRTGYAGKCRVEQLLRWRRVTASEVTVLQTPKHGDSSSDRAVDRDAVARYNAHVRRFTTSFAMTTIAGIVSPCMYVVMSLLIRYGPNSSLEMFPSFNPATVSDADYFGTLIFAAVRAGLSVASFIVFRELYRRMFVFRTSNTNNNESTASVEVDMCSLSLDCVRDLPGTTTAMFITVPTFVVCLLAAPFRILS